MTAESGANSGTRITVEDLEFEYGAEFDLKLKSLHVEAQERVALIGPSGCGKSTLLALLAGILTPRVGTLRLDARDLTKLSEAERRALRLSRIGLVFQEFELLDHLSVRENVLLPLLLLGQKIDRNELREIVETLDVGAKLERKPRSLSQGERQRVALARALITKPPLLLADEPTGNLDPETTRRTLNLLLESSARFGATLLFVTHDASLLDRFDRVIDFREIVT